MIKERIKSAKKSLRKKLIAGATTTVMALGALVGFAGPAVADATAPTLSDVTVSGTSATGTTLNFTSDEAGTYFYLVYADTATAPNAAAVVAQGPAVTKGTEAAIADPNTATISGLVAGTSYEIYLVVRDATGNVSTVSVTELTTTGNDETAPVLSAVSVSGASDIGATLNFTSDEAGTYFYRVFPGGTEPQAAPVIDQTGPGPKGTAPATATAQTVTISGLVQGTTYEVHLVVRDAIENVSQVSVTPFITLTTLEAVAETAVSAYESGTSAELAAAQTAVDALPAGQPKTFYQARITVKAVDVIEAYAAASNAAAMTIAQLVAAGVTGAVEGNLTAYKTAIAAALDTAADTTGEIQTIIDTVNTEAIETAAQAAAATAVAAYEAGTSAALTAAQAAVDSVTDATAKAGFQTRITTRTAALAAEALAAAVDVIEAYAAASNAAAMTIAQLVAAGVTGTVEGNLAGYKTAIAAALATAADTTGKIQTIINTVNTAASAGSSSGGGGGSASLPTPVVAPAPVAAPVRTPTGAFAPNSATLTKELRVSIRKALAANPNAKAAICRGFVASGAASTADRKLARDRSTAVCNRITRVNPDLDVEVKKVVVASSSKQLRKVRMVLR